MAQDALRIHLMTAKMLLATLRWNVSNLNSCKEFKAQCTNLQFTANSKVSQINKGNKRAGRRFTERRTVFFPPKADAIFHQV